ncbi:MAG TPA: hypothetical protein VK590_12660 [Saprospiraceae bacterium]|nr:hypothetical protein [Saprospiraceae bacterium]
MHDEEEFIISTMESGANGYLLKNAQAQEIYNAIMSCINTGYYFNTIISKLILDNKINLKMKY